MVKLKVNIVMEILGRPPEHVKEALNTLVVKMGSEKGIKVLNKIYHDPVEVKDSKDLFTAFAEVSLELDTLADYFAIIFSYMPSHIEVVSPETISLSNSELNELANQLTLRLHNYDAITKKMLFERDFLVKKLREVAPELFKQLAQEEKEQLEEAKKKKESQEKEKSLEESLSDNKSKTEDAKDKPKKEKKSKKPGK